MIFAYFGPETVLPLASVVATVLGVFMMFGRLTLKFALAPFQWIWTRGRAKAAPSAMKGPTAWRRGASLATARVESANDEAREEA